MVWNENEVLELIEEWAENQNPPYKCSDFTNEKTYHPTNSTINKYVGGWYKALESLNLSTGNLSRNEIISIMKKLDKKTDGVVTQKVIHDSNALSMGKFYSGFDSLPEFRQNHDLETSPAIQRSKKDVKTLWEENREKCLERDNRKCQDCGKMEKNASISLSVHHEIPKKAFKSEKHAHRLKNLITLCSSCHADRHNSNNGFRPSES